MRVDGKNHCPAGRQAKKLKEPLHIVIPLPPVTKKNHGEIVFIGRKCPSCGRGAHPKLLPSDQFRRYAKDAGMLLGKARGLWLSGPMNLKATYFVGDHSKSDLVNYHQALLDLLVEYGVILDDDSSIIAGTDGSRVAVDRKNPRTEATLSPIPEDKEDSAHGKER